MKESPRTSWSWSDTIDSMGAFNAALHRSEWNIDTTIWEAFSGAVIEILLDTWRARLSIVDVHAGKDLAVKSAWLSSLGKRDQASLGERTSLTRWSAAISLAAKLLMSETQRMAMTWADAGSDSAGLTDSIASAWKSAVTSVTAATLKEMRRLEWLASLSVIDGRRYSELDLRSSWLIRMESAIKAIRRETARLSWTTRVSAKDISASIESLSQAWVSVLTAVIVITVAEVDVDDWYNLIEAQILKTIQSDLSIGTAGTLVQTIEAKLRADVRSYYDYELPAIAIKALESRRIYGASSGHFDKFFQYIIHVIHRAGDLDEGVNSVQEILSGIEDVIGRQYQPGSDLHGLGTHADVRGGPIIRLTNSEIGFRSLDQLNFEVVALHGGEIEIITD